MRSGSWFSRTRRSKQARDASGASAILVAAYNMKPDVVNALVELGAPVDIFEASVLGKVDRIEEILKSSPARVSEHAPDGFTPVALAAFFGQPAAVKALIAAGADVNAAAKNAAEGRRRCTPPSPAANSKS